MAKTKKTAKAKKTEAKPAKKAEKKIVKPERPLAVFFVPGFGNVIVHDEQEAAKKANEIIAQRKEP